MLSEDKMDDLHEAEEDVFDDAPNYTENEHPLYKVKYHVTCPTTGFYGYMYLPKNLANEVCPRKKCRRIKGTGLLMCDFTITKC